MYTCLAVVPPYSSIIINGAIECIGIQCFIESQGRREGLRDRSFTFDGTKGDDEFVIQGPRTTCFSHLFLVLFSCAILFSSFSSISLSFKPYTIFWLYQGPTKSLIRHSDPRTLTTATSNRNGCLLVVTDSYRSLGAR